VCRTGDPLQQKANLTVVYKRERKDDWLQRKSEGRIVPFEVERQHNARRGKVPCFVEADREARREVIA